MMRRSYTALAAVAFLAMGCEGISDLGNTLGLSTDGSQAGSFAQCAMVYDEFANSLANAKSTRFTAKQKAAELKTLRDSKARALALAEKFSSAKEVQQKYQAAQQDYAELRKGKLPEVLKTMTAAKKDCDQKLSANAAKE